MDFLIEKVMKGVECCSIGYCVESECPYYHKTPDIWKNADCNTELARDAFSVMNYFNKQLKQAKSQIMRGESTARLLNYDEATNAEIVFVEIKRRTEIYPIIRFEKNNQPYWCSTRGVFSNIVQPERYLKIVRCWSNRPTDAQRDAAPWEG